MRDERHCLDVTKWHHWEWRWSDAHGWSLTLVMDTDDEDEKRQVYAHVNQRMGVSWGKHLKTAA